MDRANFNFQYKKHKSVSYYESAVVRVEAPADRNNGSGSELPTTNKSYQYSANICHSRSSSSLCPCSFIIDL